MDSEEIGILFFIMGLFIIGLCITYIVIMDSFRIAEADITCKNASFETYVSYKNYPFQVQSKALVCGTMRDRMIYEGKIKAYDSNGANIIVQEVKK